MIDRCTDDLFSLQQSKNKRGRWRSFNDKCDPNTILYSGVNLYRDACVKGYNQYCLLALLVQADLLEVIDDILKQSPGELCVILGSQHISWAKAILGQSTFT